MGKFPFKRPRIISKKFPEMDSTIDGVTKSLNDLVFSYSEKVDKAIQKKHLMMAMSSMVLLVVLGSFISPKGNADISTFYPDTCLGGWINPRHAEGELQTTSNGDETQFNQENSAILPENTNAEMYCGNFKGKFDGATNPTKIIVSLALTKGGEISLENIVIDSTSTVLTPVATSSLEIASSTLMEATSTYRDTPLVTGTGTENIEPGTVQGSSTFVTDTSSTTAVASPEKPEEGSTIIDGIIQSVKDTISDILNIATPSTVHQTDTVVIPQEEIKTPEVSSPPQESKPEEQPTSFLHYFKKVVISSFFQKVFAEVEDSSDTSPSSTTPIMTTQEVLDSDNKNISDTPEISSSSTQLQENITDSIVGADTIPLATTTEATTTSEIATTTDLLVSATTSLPSSEVPNHSQNNFLEVFYSFDGLTWVSLGELNEISMKYRTFEIPVTASTSWTDMGQLQIKIEAKKHEMNTPIVFLDGIKVEVLYDSVLAHSHPDFSRDTILNDETINGVRLITLINHETNQEEVWYMYLEDIATSSMVVATSSVDTMSTSTLATSTMVEAPPLDIKKATTSDDIASSTSAYVEVGTSSPRIKPIVPKNVWMKFSGKVEKGITAMVLVEQIKKLDENQEKVEEVREDPDFTIDIIKRIKGAFLDKVIVQLLKDNKEELWLYDVENSTKEKISAGTSTSLSVDSPIGIKGGYLFWLSEDSTKIFAYNLTTKEIQQQEVPPYNKEEGGRSEIIFEGIFWKVIVSASGFAFFSEATGEVFSDDNGSVAEALRQKLQLDKVLDAEELSNLNLHVKEVEAKEVEATIESQ